MGGRAKAGELAHQAMGGRRIRVGYDGGLGSVVDDGHVLASAAVTRPPAAAVVVDARTRVMTAWIEGGVGEAHGEKLTAWGGRRWPRPQAGGRGGRRWLEVGGREEERKLENQVVVPSLNV
jgi:hypothetical protein